MIENLNYEKIIKDLTNEFEDIRIMAIQTLLRIDNIEEEFKEKIIVKLNTLIKDNSLDVVYLAKQLSDKLGVYNKNNSVNNEIKNSNNKIFEERLKNEKDPILLSNLINEIGKLQDKNFFKTLLPYLRHSDNRVRANTVEAIGSLEMKNAVLAIIYMVDDPDNRVKGNALKYLKLYDEPKVAKVLNEMLRSKEIRMVESALYVLEQYKLEDVLETLYLLLENKYEKIRFRTIKILKKYPTRETVKKLMLLKDDNDIQIAQEALATADILNDMLKNPIELEKKEEIKDNSKIKNISNDMKKMFSNAQKKMVTAVENIELTKIINDQYLISSKLAKKVIKLLECSVIKDQDISKLFYERLKILELVDKKKNYVEKSKNKKEKEGILAQLKSKIKGNYEVKNIERSIKTMEENICKIDNKITKIFIKKHFDDHKNNIEILNLVKEFQIIEKDIKEKKIY